MIGGHYFKRLRQRRALHSSNAPPNDDALPALLAREVIEQFRRVSDLPAQVIPLSRAGPEVGEEPYPPPCHPACAEHADSDYCRESWQLHLAALGDQPEAHWHKCDHGRLCALVPVVYHDRCLAVVKLACPASMIEEDFEVQVHVLDALVKAFVVSEAAFLSRLLRTELAPAERGAPPTPGAEEPEDRPPVHPQVSQAQQYIAEHLSDPKLTVVRMARELNLHPYYLSHLFAEQVGQRMNRFIAARRIELAKTLLATTGGQIKHIARQCGYANANWFVHVFAVHTGVTPGEYRRKARGSARAAGEQ